MRHLLFSSRICKCSRFVCFDSKLQAFSDVPWGVGEGNNSPRRRRRWIFLNDYFNPFTDAPCTAAEYVGTGRLRRRPKRTAMFTIQHCAPVPGDIEETDDVSALTAYVNEALDSLDPYASSLGRDCGSPLMIMRRMPKESVCV